MEAVDTLLAKVEQQYLRLDRDARWTEKKIPHISLNSFTLEEIIDKGRNSIYCITPSQQLLELLESTSRGYVAKKQELGDASDDALEMTARAITLDADTKHHRNTGLLRTQAFATDETAVYTIDSRYDLDANPFIKEARTLLHMDRVAGLVGRISQDVATTIAQFHRDDGVHRDIKPSNIGILRNEFNVEKVLVTDFDLVSRQERIIGPGLTTRLSDRGTFIGTPEFLPDDYLLGRRSLNEFTPMELDGYALGITMKYLLSGELPIQRDAFMETLVGERLRYLSREERWPPLERSLHRIAIKATAKHGRYESMDEMAFDIERALRSDFKAVEKNTEHAWVYRNGELEGRRTITRRWFIRGAVVIAAGAPIWNIVDPLQKIDDYQYRKEYAASLSGLANAAAEFNPAALAKFKQKESEHFKAELEKYHMPQLKSGAHMKVAIGSVDGWQIPTWTGAGNSYIGHMLARLHLHWKRTNDSYFMECYTKIAKAVNLGLNPASETGDLRMSTVARVENFPAVYSDKEALPQEVLPEIETGFWKSLIGISAAYNQYSEKCAVFGPYFRDGDLIVYTNQERIMPLLAIIADPAFDSSLRDKVLRAEYSPKELELAGVRSLPPLRKFNFSDVYRMNGKTGVMMLQTLWHNKRSYTQAFVGDKIIRKTGSTDPGFEFAEHLQPVVTQDLTLQMLGHAYRLWIHENSHHPVLDAQLRDELKGRYAQFREETDADAAIIRKGFGEMNAYYRSGLNENGLPPEYLFMPPQLKNQLPFRLLEHDALAAVRYGYAMKLLKRERTETASLLLKHSPMNHAPRKPNLYKVGTLVSARAGRYEYHGTCTEADRYFDELLEIK